MRWAVFCRADSNSRCLANSSLSHNGFGNLHTHPDATDNNAFVDIYCPPFGYSDASTNGLC
jgi:hypothetical protein